MARFGSTGSGDAPEFTTNAANQVLEVTYALPGGVMLTTRGGGNVWSYPNIHGDRLMRHEAKHADQWAALGGNMAWAYPAAYAVQGKCNVFERAAGYRDGGYKHC